MAKLAVFIDHDIVIRHFIHNGILLHLQKEHDVIFVFPNNSKRVQIRPEELPLGRMRAIPVSNKRQHLYRRLYQATVLMKTRQMAIRHRQATMKFWRSVLGPRAFCQSWLCSWPLSHPVYRSYMFSRIGNNEVLDKLLQDEAPDLIVHPTVLEGLFVSDLVRWGEANRKPTLFIMNSWDNPATKALIVGCPDRLVVWGEQTRRHAMQHMGVPPEKIACLGAAQFDLYRKPPKVSPSEYRRRLGVPDHWKVLLYAGSSKGLNETYHLIQLEEAIERGQLKNCVVLYRPHPWRDYPKDEADFFSLKWKHVMFEPSMEACYRQSRQKERIHIELANYEDTHITLSAVDVVISPLSTILLEAAMHGKPVAVYLPDEDMTSNTFLFTVANLAHFRDFFEQVECIMCERPEDLIKDCEQLLRLRDDPGISERLQKQCAYFVEPSDRPYADQLSSLIRSLLSPPPSRPPIQKA